MAAKKLTIIDRIKARKKLILVIVLALLVLPRLGSGRGSEEIETTEIKRGEVIEELVLSGEIKAEEHAQLAFQTAGTISYVGVKEGDDVFKGNLLAKLDTTKLNADLQRARSDLRDKEATLLRVYDDVKDAGESESFSEKESRTTAEVAKDKAYEDVLKAEKDLRNASLYAPFAGVVTQVTNPFSGVNVLTTQTQIEIVNPESIYFEVSADQTEVILLKEDQSVNIVLDSYEELDVKGTITNISLTPKLGETTTVYKIKIEIDESSLDGVSPRIGMTGDARFVLSEKDDVLWAPSTFIGSDKEGSYVLTDKDKKVYIEVGLEGEERTEIEGEIEEGQTIYD